MAAITPQVVSRSGTNVTLAACSGGGDTCANDGRTMLVVDNASGGALTVTVESFAAAGVGLARQDVSVSVPAAGRRYIGPFPTDAFNGASGLNITYSGVTGLTIAAVRLPS